MYTRKWKSAKLQEQINYKMKASSSKVLQSEFHSLVNYTEQQRRNTYEIFYLIEPSQKLILLKFGLYRKSTSISYKFS